MANIVAYFGKAQTLYNRVLLTLVWSSDRKYLTSYRKHENAEQARPDDDDDDDDDTDNVSIISATF